MTCRHIDLFSGIGGFTLSAQTVWGDEHEIVCFVEQDEFCQKVLGKHWPGVPIVEDVRDVRQIMAYTNTGRLYPFREGFEKQIKEGFTDYTSGQCENDKNDIKSPDIGSNVDLLTGGFPCQGFSVAGKRRGKEDDRYLWPEMFEVIKAVKPTYIIGENVTGIINMALDTVLSDLEDQGYAAQAFIIPACAQNAPHRRDRVWIVANTGLRVKGERSNSKQVSNRGNGSERSTSEACRSGCESKDVADNDNQRCEKQCSPITVEKKDLESKCSSGWLPQSEFCRVASRLPQRLDPNQWDNGEWEGVPRVAVGVKDRVNRLKALGNAIVPQVVIPIMEAIKKIDML